VLAAFHGLEGDRVGIYVRRFGSLIPGSDVKLSSMILAGSRVLSAVGASPPHDGIG